jgi:hypothetical protein
MPPIPGILLEAPASSSVGTSAPPGALASKFGALSTQLKSTINAEAQSPPIAIHLPKRANDNVCTIQLILITQRGVALSFAGSLKLKRMSKTCT